MKRLSKIIIRSFLVLAFFGPAALILATNHDQSSIAKVNSHRLSDSTNLAVLPSTTTPTPEAVNVYRPSSVDLKTRNNWKAKYPSEVSAQEIVDLFQFTNQISSNGLATASASGYKFSNVDDKGALGDSYSASEFETKTKNAGKVGEFQRANITDLFAKITARDDLNGTLQFKLLQPLKFYQNKNNQINPTATPVGAQNTLAVITPPTKYQASNKDGEKIDDVWTLPVATYPLQKVSYLFTWKPSNLINAFLNTFTGLPEDLTEDQVRTNFFDLTSTLQNVRNSSLPQTKIELSANSNLGTLKITISLLDDAGEVVDEAGKGFVVAGGANPSVVSSISRTFYGFKSTNPIQATNPNTVVTAINSSLLVNSIISSPMWDPANTSTAVGATGVTYIGQKISTLLPSQFVNLNTGNHVIGNPTFLDIFNGNNFRWTNTSGQAASGPAIRIIGNNTTSNSAAIGSILYLGIPNSQAEANDLPKFDITKIEALPNDRLGTLKLIIYHNSITRTGELTTAPIRIVDFNGFSRDFDSGKTLFFSWKNNLPQQYSNNSAEEIISRFNATAQTVNSASNSSNTVGYTSAPAAKAMIQEFFNGSDYLIEKYRVSYSSELQDGAEVAMNLSPSGSGKNNLEVVIIFGRFNGQINYTLRKVFPIESIRSAIPSALQARIMVKPEFLDIAKNISYNQKLPSSLSTDEIKEMFDLTIPQGGDQYTTTLDAATIFYVPNDKLGSLAVSLILPKFNNIENFEFSQMFSGFKINAQLTRNLVLEYNNPQFFSTEFLAKNPMSELSLTPTDILQSLFQTVNNTNVETGIFSLLTPNDIQIIKRDPLYVIVQITINWSQLISGNLANPTSNQAAKTKQKMSQEDDTADDNAAAADKETIQFRISGFTGGGGIRLNNQTPATLQKSFADSTITIVAGAISGVLETIFLGIAVPLSIRFRRFQKLKKSHDQLIEAKKIKDSNK